jgi:hypothetical protein
LHPKKHDDDTKERTHGMIGANCAKPDVTLTRLTPAPGYTWKGDDVDRLNQAIYEKHCWIRKPRKTK